MQSSKQHTSHHNILKAGLILFFSSLYMYSHIATLYMQERGLNLMQVSSITSIITITIFALEVPTGIVGDKIGRKWSVVIAMFLQAIGEYLYYLSHSYTAFVFIAILAGAGYAFLSGALESLVYDSLPEQGRDTHMKKAWGKIGAAGQFAFVLAPLIGGFIVTEQNIEHYLFAILATAFSVTVAFFVALTLKEPPSDFEHSEKSPLLILKNGIKIISSNRKLVLIVLFAVFTTTFVGLLGSLYQPYFAENGISAMSMGLGLSLAALLSSLLQYFAHMIEKKIGSGWGVVILTILPALSYIALGFVSGTILPIIFFIATYGLASAKDPLISAYENREIPSAYRNTTLSLINMVRNIFVAGGGLVIGAIADKSLSGSFIFIGLYILLAIVVVIIVGRNKLKFSGE